MSNIVWVGAAATNFNTGRVGYPVRGIIIHTIVGTLGGADGAFLNPARQASAHYGVACDGSVVHQYVREADTAWHCGRYYPDAADPLANVNTVGIEHCDNGNAFAPRSDEEYAASAQLVREVAARYGIPIDRAHIRKHSEVSVAPTGCPDTLDIDRIVAMANGTYGPVVHALTGGDDDMVYVSKFHPAPAVLAVFAAGSSYLDPCDSPFGKGAEAAGNTIGVDGYVWSSSPIQSTDLDGNGTAGPDYVWWHATSGQWVPDAILTTSGVAALPAPPAPAIPAAEPMARYAALKSELAAAGAPGQDGAPGKDGLPGKDGAPGQDGASPDPQAIALVVMQRIGDAARRALGIA